MTTREQDNALSELATEYTSLRCRVVNESLAVEALDIEGEVRARCFLDEDGQRLTDYIVQGGVSYGRARVCGQPVRGMAGLVCTLDREHGGYHSASTFGCDGCGRTLRAQPHQSARDPDGVPVADFCFMCCREHERAEGYRR